MTDVIEIGKMILNAGATSALMGFLVVLAIPKLKKKIFGNGYDEQARLINERLTTFEDNHLHTIEEVVRTNKEQLSDFKRTMEDHNREELKVLYEILNKIKNE